MKVEIYGSESCSRCEQVKNILQNKNIEFEYLNIEELDPIIQKVLYKNAKLKNIMSAPILVVEEEVMTLQEVLQRCS